MGTGREIGHTVARANSESLQNRRRWIAPIEKLGVAPARRTIDHGDLFRINFPGAASEFEWRQRRFHIWSRKQKLREEQRLCQPSTDHWPTISTGISWTRPAFQL